MAIQAAKVTVGCMSACDELGIVTFSTKVRIRSFDMCLSLASCTLVNNLCTIYDALGQ